MRLRQWVIFILTYLIDLSWRETPLLSRMEPRKRLVGLRECDVMY